MPFVRIPGLVGKVYVPETQPEQEKKHRCKDCFCCQQCSEERCQLCRSGIESKKESEKTEPLQKICHQINPACSSSTQCMLNLIFMG